MNKEKFINEMHKELEVIVAYSNNLHEKMLNGENTYSVFKSLQLCNCEIATKTDILSDVLSGKINLSDFKTKEELFDAFYYYVPDIFMYIGDTKAEEKEALKDYIEYSENTFAKACEGYMMLAKNKLQLSNLDTLKTFMKQREGFLCKLSKNLKIAHLLYDNLDKLKFE